MLWCCAAVVRLVSGPNLAESRGGWRPSAHRWGRHCVEAEVIAYSNEIDMLVGLTTAIQRALFIMGYLFNVTVVFYLSARRAPVLFCEMRH